MKIGILTFHNAENYGAVLQCYALQTYLSTITDKEVCVIDYKNKEVKQQYSLLYKKPENLTSLFKQLITVPIYLLPKIKKKVIFHTFIKKKLNLKKFDFSLYETIIYGSDQIWNPTLTGGIDFYYFGKDNNNKKIGYAISDGNELVLFEDNTELLKKINSFDYLSFRENTTSKKIKEIIPSKKIDTVCDPVFLIDKSAWLSISTSISEKNYILVYKIIDNKNIDIEAEYLSKKLNKKIIEIVYIKSLKKFFKKDRVYLKGISPEHFISYFANADFVLTTSFHGTAFSIIFRKPFYVLSLSKRSERITDLLENINLEKNYISTIKNSDLNFNPYTLTCEKKLNEIIDYSKEYLKTAM